MLSVYCAWEKEICGSSGLFRLHEQKLMYECLVESERETSIWEFRVHGQYQV
jgi:hypothetical protein